MRTPEPTGWSGSALRRTGLAVPGAFFVAVTAFFAVLFTGRDPAGHAVVPGQRGPVSASDLHDSQKARRPPDPELVNDGGAGEDYPLIPRIQRRGGSAGSFSC